MKKIILISALYLAAAFSTPVFANVINKTQLIKSDHWIYDAMATLEGETKHPFFTETAPLTAGEIEFYFKQVDRSELSDAGKAIYDDIDSYLHTKPFGFYRKNFGFSFNLSVNPELTYKSNTEIDWSYRYNYRDPILNAPLRVCFADYFTAQLDIFLGKNFDGSQKAYNFTNMPVATNEIEFRQPTWAYGAGGATFDDWGFSFVLAKEGHRIGKALTGSVIYNDTFETDFFGQFSIYGKYFKYILGGVQVNKDRFMYIHHFEANIVNRLKLIIMEGSLVSGPFELRHWNPAMFMHAFGMWRENKDRSSAQYVGILLEFHPVKNMKLYWMYGQNEVTLAGFEENDGHPWSAGMQLGCDFKIPSKNGGKDEKPGFWHGTVEGIWTTPYFYIKQTEANSFYSRRIEHHGDSAYVESWMGTPFGPDCLGISTEFGFEKQQKWSVKLGYSLIAHGETRFINRAGGSPTTDKDKQTYDPSGETFNKPTYDLGKDRYNEDYPKDKNGNTIPQYYPHEVATSPDATDEQKKKALDDAENIWPSGTVEFKNIITVKGTYNINRFAQLSGKVSYTFVANNKNITGNFQHGVEMTVSCKCELLK